MRDPATAIGARFRLIWRVTKSQSLPSLWLFVAFMLTVESEHHRAGAESARLGGPEQRGQSVEAQRAEVRGLEPRAETRRAQRARRYGSGDVVVIL